MRMVQNASCAAGIDGFRSVAIVSHVVHYCSGKRLYAYGPYAREIDIWADLFPDVLIAAPCRDEVPPADCLAFTRTNISVLPQKEISGPTVARKLRSLVSLPALLWGLTRAMRRADAIHVRCPGNLGLLGVILAPLFSRRLIAKYAGQWRGYPAEPWTVRLQRALLRSPWWRGPVTVYGRWPRQSAKVVSFFTSALTADQLRRAAAAKGKKMGSPLRTLFVGRLSAAKNVHVLLEALALLKAGGTQAHCAVVGEGPARESLEARSAELGLGDGVEFAGGASLDRVLSYYERCDVLVLASESEGWPKAIAEAMAFGLVCVGSNRGLVPEMLAEGGGVVVEPGDARALADALRRIAAAPEEYDAMRARAAAWGERYSLEALREALRELLVARWNLSPAGALHAGLRTERARP